MSSSLGVNEDGDPPPITCPPYHLVYGRARLESLEPGTVDDGRPSCWLMMLHIRFVAGGSCGCRPVSWGA